MDQKDNNTKAEMQSNIQHSKECHSSPDGFHHPQDSAKNTIPACTFCGKIV